jgi:hypothetical protein
VLLGTDLFLFPVRFANQYGTAGFREKAEILDSTFFRMGMLALLRSRQMEKVRPPLRVVLLCAISRKSSHIHRPLASW